MNKLSFTGIDVNQDSMSWLEVFGRSSLKNNSIYLAFIIYPHAAAIEENFVHISMKGISR